jgi:hypothetical protein
VLAGVDAVEVDVDERTKCAVLVEDQIGDRQRAESLADGRRVDLEAALPAGLVAQDPREEDYGDSPTSIERMDGRSRATSVHSSPSDGET